MSRKTLIFWMVFAVFLILDQVTKVWVYTNLEYRVDEIVLIPHFLSIVHAQNPGAAFGILTTFAYRHLVFLAFTVIAVVIIVDMYRRLESDDRFGAVALGLILSGAVGNGIDRVHKQTVTDFIRIYTDDPEWVPWLRNTFGMAEWPSFNVADSTLLIGVIMFLVHSMFFDTAEERLESTEPALGTPPKS